MAQGASVAGMSDWRAELDGQLRDDVARLDAALGVRLPHREVVDALIDPRGHLFQRLEYVGDSILDAVVLQALVAMQPWTESSLRFLSVEQQALVSDHALGRVAARRGLPDVRTFEVSVHRLGDRVEACIGAVWAELGIEAAQDVADRLVVRPGLHGRLITATVPDAGGDDRYEELPGCAATTRGNRPGTAPRQAAGHRVAGSPRSATPSWRRRTRPRSTSTTRWRPRRS